MNIGEITSSVPGANMPVPLQRDSTSAVVTENVSAQNAGTADFDYTVSQIRVDVDADLAILEFKSVKTGDVVRQYPTEKQIAGYQRAAQLVESKNQREATFGVQNPGSKPNDVTPSTATTSGGTSNIQASAAQPTYSSPNSGSASVNVNAGTPELSNAVSVSA